MAPQDPIVWCLCKISLPLPSVVPDDDRLASLWDCQAALDGWLTVSIWLIVVGLLFEAMEWLPPKRIRLTFVPLISRSVLYALHVTRHSAIKVGEVLVIAGVAAELALHVGSSGVLIEVRGIQDARSARMSKDTEILKQQNLLLQLRVDEAKRLAGPRNIREPSIRTAMQAKLAPFAGTPYDLTVPLPARPDPLGNSLEPGSFLVDDIIDVLVMSGWKLHSVEGGVAKAPLPFTAGASAMLGLDRPLPKTMPVILVGELSGVAGVRIVLPSDDKMREAASALEFALRAAGIWAGPEFGTPYNTIPVGVLTGDAIHIIIGTKP